LNQITDFKESLEQFVSAFLPNKPLEPRSDKIIHDSVWGTEEITPLEIAFLDTPLFQRLRFIHQTGFAYSVYPTSSHSRFEHTLGVISQISRFAIEINSRYPRLLSKKDIHKLRLSALFHDVGHGLFSHASESIYGLMPVVRKLVDNGGEFEGRAPHEVISYLILQTKKFKEIFNEITLGKIDLTDVADVIIRKHEPEFKYKCDFLCSILDADKIDYIHRDAKFSGLPLTIDLERLKHAISILDYKENNKSWRVLSVLYTGATPLEQILISRFMLYPMLYHHHKIRACDCMFQGIIEYIKRNRKTIKLSRQKVSFTKPIDFLWGNDGDFLGAGMRMKPTDPLHILMHDLVYRRLLKRVAILSHRTVDNVANFANLLALRDSDSLSSKKELRDIAKDITARAKIKGINLMSEQIWIDLPKNPTKKGDIEAAKVLYPNGDYVDLTEVFPIGEWVELYDINRWQGFVFSPPGTQDDLAKIVNEVFKERYNFGLKEEAFKWCHVNPP